MTRTPPRSAPCDPVKVATFDVSKLDPALSGVPKPAQRALVNAGLLTPRALAAKTKQEVLALHGVGPASLPALEAALSAEGLSFASTKKR